MDPFKIIPATAPEVPIIISIPHCGTALPEGLINVYDPERIEDLDDCDWFLQDLNVFAAELGITVIHAVYHRWVIDLNRDPQSAPLYNDGRIITGLTSTTDFFGKPIYKEGMEPDQEEIDRRLETYYWPYYRKVEELLKQRKEQFGEVLLWDAHSIRRLVPTIRQEPFPEMILGNNDEKSCRADLIETALTTLRSVYEVSHNTPFKGGHITRYFGNPENGVHTLQLERNKNLYMDDTERNYHPERAAKMQEVLKEMFAKLIGQLQR